MSRAPRVLQASAWYPPQTIGGTEVYLSGLVESLAERGVASTVLVPQAEGVGERYSYEQIPVSTYPRLAKGAQASLAAFEALLRDSQADIYHQHSWTPDCGLQHLQAARRAGLKIVLTVHVPNSLCLRGTMMRFGVEACEGQIDERSCAACSLQGHGAPRVLANFLAEASRIGPLGRMPGRLGSALTARSQVQTRRSDVAMMIEAADHVVAVCQWLDAALALNGVPSQKLSLSRQGVSRRFLQQVAAMPPRPLRDGVLSLLYLGRWHPVKGIDVVVRAMRRRPQAPIRLTIHAPDGGAEEAEYRRAVQSLAEGDPRIVIAPAVDRDAVAQTLAAHDMLVVPSLCLETGPLVALEALAVGLPVLGTQLGGLVELIDSPAKGRLIRAGDVAAWADAFESAIHHGATRSALNPNPVRSMGDAAEDMIALYHGLAVGR